MSATDISSSTRALRSTDPRSASHFGSDRDRAARAADAAANIRGAWNERCAHRALALACIVAIGVGCGARGDAVESAPEKAAAPPFVATPGGLEREKLQAAIDGARAYILRHTSAEGRFSYVVRGDGTTVATKYNVLRHAGTIYALSEILGRSQEVDHPTRDVAEAIARASSYLIRRHVDAFPHGGAGALAVWSLPGEELDRKQRAAKLGGSGLGLVALCAAHRLDPKRTPINILRGLAMAIASMQRDDGSFLSKYIEGEGPATGFVSLYYPGEAVLGLVRLAQIDPDPRWVDVASRAVANLMATREDVADDELPADHWLLIAVGELSAHVAAKPELRDRLRDSVGSVDAMQTHALRIADRMLAEQREAGAGGAFGSDRRSTPTATRLEGLLALLASLPESHSARPRLSLGAVAGVRFLFSCQVGGKDTPRAGGLTRGCVGGIDERRADEIRIDYVQHALSAFLGARAHLVLTGSPKPRGGQDEARID